MDPTLLSLLDSIPQKAPRSKLETHRELIRRLRRKGCVRQTGWSMAGGRFSWFYDSEPITSG